MRKWRALIIAFFLLLGLIGLGAWAVYRYPISLKTIVVEGNRYVTRPALARALAPYAHRNALVLSGLGVISRDLERQLPQIQSVDTDFKWPHAIVVTITEKKPWIGIQSPKGGFVLSDDGTVLRKDPDGNFWEAGLIVVDDVPELFVTPRGVHPYLLNNLRPIVTTIRRYFPIEPIELELVGLYLAPTHCSFDALTMTFQHGVRVQVGPDQDMAQKVSDLWQYLSVVPNQPSENRQIDYIDLRVPGKVIVRYGS